MDKDVLSIPFKPQLATPDLSPRTEEVNLCGIDSQADICYADVIDQLLDRVSNMRATLETLQRRINQLERGNTINLPNIQRANCQLYPPLDPIALQVGTGTQSEDPPTLEVFQVKPPVSSPPQWPVKKPGKILERIKYFELLHQTQEVLKNQRQLSNLKIKSFMKYDEEVQANKKSVPKCDAKGSQVQSNLEPKNKHTAEERFEKLEIAVELLQQRLNKLDLIQKDLEVEPELQSTIRVRVKRAQLENELEKCSGDLDHVTTPLQVKAYYKKHSKESIDPITGNSLTRSNTSFSNIPDAQTPSQIKPFLQKTGFTRQRKVGYKCNTRANRKRKGSVRKSRRNSTGSTQVLDTRDQSFNYTLSVSLVIAMIIMALLILY